MKEFSPAKCHIDVSVGESVRILRELQELSQNELADISGIPQSTISAIENDRVSLRQFPFPLLISSVSGTGEAITPRRFGLSVRCRY